MTEDEPMAACETIKQDIALNTDETLEDLQRAGFRMLQKKDGFRFGLDSVLLAAYAASFYSKRPNQPVRIADLGAGSGAVSLLLAARLPSARLAGIEIDSASADVLRRNCRLNRLEDRLQVFETDIRTIFVEKQGESSNTIRDASPGRIPDVEPSLSLTAGSFDLVVSNPPYRLPERSWRRPEPSRQQLAREEIQLTLDDLFEAARRLLKPRGRLVLVHQADRLPEVLAALAGHSLEPRTLRPVQTNLERAPAIFLLSALYQGKPGGFRLEPPLLIQEQPGVPGREITDWYGRELPLTQDELYHNIRIVPVEPTGG
jgi:tRNA1Val (adenine37-N6)-methyltransferase